MALPLPRSRLACGPHPEHPKDMPRLCLHARRFPAGVDHQFDDTESESRALIRQALGGHVFEAGLADRHFDEGYRSSRSVKRVSGWPA
jgi:hypothetical protein